MLFAIFFSKTFIQLMSHNIIALVLKPVPVQYRKTSVQPLS